MSAATYSTSCLKLLPACPGMTTYYLNPEGVECYQFAINRYNALLLNHWKNATGELPPTNHDTVPDIRTWTFKQLMDKCEHYFKFCQTNKRMCKASFKPDWTMEAFYAFNAVSLEPIAPDDLSTSLVEGDMGLPKIGYSARNIWEFSTGIRLLSGYHEIEGFLIFLFVLLQRFLSYTLFFCEKIL